MWGIGGGGGGGGGVWRGGGWGSGVGCGGSGVWSGGGVWGSGCVVWRSGCVHSIHKCNYHPSLYMSSSLPPSFLSLLPSCRPVRKCSTVLVVVHLSLLIPECVGSVGRMSSSAISVGKQTQHDH